MLEGIGTVSSCDGLHVSLPVESSLKQHSLGLDFFFFTLFDFLFFRLLLAACRGWLDSHDTWRLTSI